MRLGGGVKLLMLCAAVLIVTNAGIEAASVEEDMVMPLEKQGGHRTPVEEPGEWWWAGRRLGGASSVALRRLRQPRGRIGPGRQHRQVVGRAPWGTPTRVLGGQRLGVEARRRRIEGRPRVKGTARGYRA